MAKKKKPYSTSAGAEFVNVSTQKKENTQNTANSGNASYNNFSKSAGASFISTPSASKYQFPSNTQSTYQRAQLPTYTPTSAPSYTQNPFARTASTVSGNASNVLRNAALAASNAKAQTNGYVTGSEYGDILYKDYLKGLEDQYKADLIQQNKNDPRVLEQEQKIKDLQNRLMEVGRRGDVAGVYSMNQELANAKSDLSKRRSELSTQLPDFNAEQAYYNSMTDETLRAYQERMRQKEQGIGKKMQEEVESGNINANNWTELLKYTEPGLSADEEVNKAQSMIDQRDWNNKYQQYMNLRTQPDFDGSYVSTYQDNGQSADRWGVNGVGEYVSTEMNKYGDITYDYLNNDPNATQVMNTMNPYGFRTGYGEMNSYYANLEPEEKQVFNHLYKQDPNKAYEFMDFMKDELERRERKNNEDYMAALAEESPVGASMLSVSTAIGSPISVASDLYSVVTTGEFNTNSWSNQFSYIPQAIRTTVSKNIAENSPLGETGSFLYNTGMSMADNLAQMMLTGGMSQSAILALMGTQVFANTVTEGVAEGKTAEDILLDAFIRSGVEVLTEKIGLDEVFEYIGGTRSFAQLMKAAGSEGAEEALSDLLNWGFDGVRQVATGRESELREKFNTYKLQGYSDSEALGKVLLDMAKEAGTDALGGALSGLAMTGSGVAVTSPYNAIATARAENRVGEQVRQMLPENHPLQWETDREIGKRMIEEETTRRDNARATEFLDEMSDAVKEKGSANPDQIKQIMENAAAVKILEENTSAENIETGLDAQNALAEYAQTHGTESSQETEKANRQGNSRPINVDVNQGKSELRNRDIMLPLRQYSEVTPVQEIEKNRIDTEAAERFGEAGSKVWQSAVQNAGIEAVNVKARQELFTDFSKAFNAGMNDQAIPEGLRLSDDIAQAAYASGQNAALDVFRDKSGRLEEEFTTSTSKKPGLEMDNALIRDAVKNKLISRRDLKGFGRLGVVLDTKLTPMEHMPQNGWYQDGKIGFSLDADNGLFHVLSHEFTHRLQETAPEEYEKLKKHIAEFIGSDELEKSLSKYYDLGKYNGMTISQTTAMDEVVADWVADHMLKGDLQWTGFLKQASRTQQGVGMLQSIRNWIRNIINKLKGSNNADIDQLTASLQKAQQLIDEALKVSEKNIAEQKKNLESKAKNQESFTTDEELQYSLRFNKRIFNAAQNWNENNRLKNGRRAVPVNVMTQAGIVMESMQQILENPEVMKLLPNEENVLSGTKDKNAIRGTDKKRSTVYGNESYGYSVENSTICTRSLAMELLLDRCAELMGHSLSTREAIALSQMAWSMTDQPTCQYCYVFADRLAQRQARDQYITQRDSVLKNIGKISAKTKIVTDADLITPVKTNGGVTEDKFVLDQAIKENPKMAKQLRAYDQFLNGRKNTENQRQRFLMFLETQKSGVSLVTREQVASEQSMIDAVNENPALQEQMHDIYDYANKASHAKAKVEYTAYNNDILKLSIKAVELMNREYGVRFYSYSDFHPAFILENMQMFLDASVRGLKGLAYTKDLDYVRIFADTGVNINISCKAIDGTTEMDAMQGADWEGAKALRDKYKNVGVVMVCTSDEQVEWALAQDWVDMVLPYHTCFSAEVGKAFNWNDYRSFQSDKKISGKWNKDTDVASISPYQHENDLEKYLDLCEKNHLEPRFSQWLDNPNYMKLVIETRQSYKVTKPLQPKFNLDAAKESIESMKKRGGYNNPFGGSVEEMNELAKDFVGRMNERFQGMEGWEDGWAATPEFAKNTQFSLRQKDVGYHAGDLGKAESLFNQSGGRSTGHFGTGTYFVGNQAKIEGYNSKNGQPAPTETADFSQYNLFKPKNYSDASALHEFMKDVDNGYGSYTGAKSTDEYNDLKEQLAERAEEFGDNGFYEAYSNDAEIIDDVVRLADSTIGRRELAKVIASRSMVGDVSAYDGSLFDEQDNEITPDDYLKGLHHDDAENIIDWIVTEADNWRSDGLRMAGRYEDWHNTFGNVSRILGVSEDTLENIITEATEEAHQIDYPASTTADSIATRVMKHLGYEGVDVRHIDQMDNTTYGSVIYDLKGEDLARKQEIGTARFSLRAQDEEYMDAYFDGDEERMQELVDEAARQAGYTYKAFHHTENAFTVFDINKARKAMDIQGFYFSADPDAESEYGSVRYDTYLKMDKPYIVDSYEKQKAIPFDMSQEDAGVTAREWLQKNGHDGVIRKAEYFGSEADEYIVFDPSQIKSAEPVTYKDDENGEGDFIPLSERFNPKNKDLRFSLRQQDSEYMELARDPKKNELALSRMVERAAREAGYDTPDLYHGTPTFGFTEFEPNHRGLIYTSSRREVSANYAGRDHYAGVKPIGKKYILYPSGVSDIIKNAETVFGVKYHVMTQEEKTNVISEQKKQGIEIADQLDKVYVDEIENNDLFRNMPDDVNNAKSWIDSLFFDIQSMDAEGWSAEDAYKYLSDDISHFDDSMKILRDWVWENHTRLKKTAPEFLDLYMGFELSDQKIYAECRLLPVLGSYVKNEDTKWLGSDGALLINELGNINTVDGVEMATERAHNIGSYHLFGDTGDNPLLLDADHSDWLSVKWGVLGEGYYSTDQIAKKAKELGYTSVVIRNVYDGGPDGDDYIFFDSSQLKSADPVTYDDAGNVIPLSERFNTESKDIRYSLRSDDYFENVTACTDAEAKVLNMVDNRNVKRYRNLVDGVFDGSIPENKVIWIGKPNARLSKYLDNSTKLVTITQNTIRKIAYPEGYKTDANMQGKHNLGISVAKNLIYQINDPMVITKNTDKHDGTVVLWTNWKTDEGQSILLSVSINQQGMVDLENRVLTAFQGNDKYTKQFFENPDNILYTKNNKSLEELITHRRHMPEIESDDTLVKRNLTQNNGDVNKRQNSLRGSQSIVESAERNASIRNGYMEAATNWRKNMTAFNDFGRSGFNTNMKALVQNYNKDLDVTTSDKIVGEIRQLTRDMVADKKMEYSDIVDRTNEIAAKVLWGKEGTTDNLLFNESAAQAIDDIRNDIMAQILKTVTRGEGKYQRLSQEFADYRKKANESISEVRRKRDARMDQIRQLKKQNQEKTDRQLETLRKQRDERIAKIRKENTEHTKELLKNVREQRDQKIKEIKQHNKDVAANRRERRIESSDRQRLLKTAKRLERIKTTKANRTLIDELIKDLDLVAVHLTEKKATDLAGLRDWYEEHKKTHGYDFIPDAYVEDAISRLEKKHIADMDIEDVRDLTIVLRNIENEIRTQNKLIDSEDRRDVFLQGEDAMAHIYASAVKGKGVLGTLDDLLIAGTLSPERAIHRYTGYVDSDPLYVATKKMSEGQRAMMDYSRRADSLFMEWTSDRKLLDKIQGSKAEEIEITGSHDGKPVTVKITPAMRMSLYLHSLNPDNLYHISHGGVRVPDIKLYKQGKLADAYAAGKLVTLSPSQVMQITMGMSAKERLFARAAHDYFNGMSQQEINEVSEKLVGYSLAEVKNYFPINSDKKYTHSDTLDEFVADSTIQGGGYLKARIKNAGNAIMLRDMTSVLNQSIKDVSRYVGLAIPVRNFKKIWNVNIPMFDEHGNFSAYGDGVQEAVASHWGTKGTQYIENLILDIDGQARKSRSRANQYLNQIRSNYAGAVLTLNLSVAMKQAASYPTAAAVLGWKPLVKAFSRVGSVDTELIAKYTPLLYYRTKGFSTTELGDIAQSSNWFNRQVASKKWLNWVQAVDLLTTKKLWKAAEIYVEDNTDLEHGTDAFYKQVAEVYNQVIEETQPNYTAMQRPDILRDDNALLQTIIMFKTQPFQNFNVIYDAIGNWSAKTQQYKANPTEENRQAMKLAQKKAKDAGSALVVSMLVFAAMTFAYSMLAGKKDKYKDKEGNVDFESIVSGIGKDMASGFAGVVPFGSEIWEIVASELFGDKYYGIDSTTVTAISDFVESCKAGFDSIVDVISTDDEKDRLYWQKKRLEWDKILKNTSKAYGLPYDNVEKLFNMMIAKGLNVKGEYAGRYEYLKLTESASYSSNKSDYYDNLYAAYKNDQSQFRNIYKDMRDFGFSKDAIKNAIESRMKEEEGVSSVKDLKKRFKAPE